MNKTCRLSGGANDMKLVSTRRYISVALFLKSPSAGVTRYPCPVEPGLSSWTAFRPAHATVCFPRALILQERAGVVNSAEILSQFTFGLI